MPSFIHELREEVLRLHVHLYACRERLLAHTDGETLHDLRVAVRRLRSLLKPLQGRADSQQLQERAQQVGRLSSPLRDLEVLIGQLHELGEHAAAERRLPQLQRGYATLAGAPALSALFAALDAWPLELSKQPGNDQAAGLDRQVGKYLRKQRKRLVRALEDPQQDRHRTRLLVKRVRYTAQAYPQLIVLPKQQLKRLKASQAVIGDWHDHLQWLGRIESDPDLAHLRATWQRSLLDAERKADRVQSELLATLR